MTVDDVEPLVEIRRGVAHVVAGRCSDCGAVMFPLRMGCPTCGAAVERTLLPPRGILWSWTTQGFEPKSPPYLPEDGGNEFVPFAVGYVEFPNYLRVQGRLVAAPEDIVIGMPMDVVAVSRGDIVIHAFAPILTGCATV